MARACPDPGFEARLIVVENTPPLHSLITCTLCSCYKRSILGQPPSWDISKAYRARAVRLRVHDSNADMRYPVLPLRSAGTEDWLQDRLATLVTLEPLIGTAPAHILGVRLPTQAT